MASQRRSARQQSREPETAAAAPPPARGRAARNTKAERNNRNVDAGLAAVVAFNNDQQLDPVAEEPADPDVPAGIPAQEMDILDAPIKATSPRSSWSEAMVRTVSDKPHLKLGDLYSRSLTLLHKLVNKPQSEQDLQLIAQAAAGVPGAQNAALPDNIANFRMTFDHYKQTKYITPKVVIKASLPGLDSNSIPQGRWRPDYVLQKANLAALADDIITAHSRRDIEDLLDEIDTSFPENFLESYQWSKGEDIPIPAGTSRRPQIGFSFLLDARTQLAICRLEKIQAGMKYNGLSSTDVVRRAFVDEEGKEKAGAANFIPRYPMATDQVKEVKSRLQHILEFSTSAGDPDMQALDAKFSFDAFKLNSVIPWIRSRNEEVEEQIASSGGVDVIADEWEIEIAKNIATTSMQTAIAPRAPAPTQRSRARRNRGGNANEDGKSGGRNDKPRGYVNNNNIDPTLQASRDHSASQLGSTQAQKRARPQHDIDGTEGASQDVGFENDAGIANMAEQRRQHLAHTGLQQMEQGGPAMTQEPFGPGSSAMPPQTPADDYKHVQERSRSMTAYNTRNKLPQQRKTWELHEINALVAGIAAYNASYSTIKKEDAKGPNFLADRDGEALRHKARNMKFDYLKIGAPFPPGFEFVLLDHKFKTKLAALGIEYHQDQARKRQPPRPPVQAAENGTEAD